jgi:class 3 adenylate cyclase/HAMP domain-containing protein
MSISRRLTLAFLTLLLLFALNTVVQTWGSNRRRDTIEELRRSLERQALIATITQGVNDVQKQVALLSGVAMEASNTGVTTDERRQFDSRLNGIKQQIGQLEKLSDASTQVQVKAVAETFDALGHSWRVFDENFGVNQPAAITELAIRAEPLSQQFILTLLPQLQKQVDATVDQASVKYDSVARLTQNFGLIIFVVSVITGILIAWRVSRYINAGLAQLHDGAQRIGSGELSHRIIVGSRDELGALAASYNVMAEKLLSSRALLTNVNSELEQRNSEVLKQQQISESLLLNILPEQVANELRTLNRVQPRYFADVTILFTDFVGFSNSTETLAAEDLVQELNGYFTDFDVIIQRYGIEKMKTIGDSYMCVAGLPARSQSHPVDMLLVAEEMLRAVENRHKQSSSVKWSVRIGVHTGPVIAGVVGIVKFAFDIWGDSVNFASRMESSGAANRINISGRTHSRVKDFFLCEPRGKVLTKDKKEVDMYFVNGLLPGLLSDDATPPTAFLNRYQIYFEKEPVAFPEFLNSQSKETIV